jgi:subtilisin-like proprotein convertase family protein
MVLFISEPIPYHNGRILEEMLFSKDALSPIRLMGLTGFVVLTASALWADSAPLHGSQARLAHTAAAYYYNGASRVDVLLSLNELVVAGNATVVGKLQSVGGVAAMEPIPGKQATFVKLASDGDRQMLVSEAARFAKAVGSEPVKAVLYRAEIPAGGTASRQILTRHLSVKWKRLADAKVMAAKYGLKTIEKVSYSPDTYIAEAGTDNVLSALETANRIYESGDAEFASPLIARQQTKRAVPNDPLFGDQWHLLNTGSNTSGAVAGNDVNATVAWDTSRGTGVNIAITDDGLQTGHPDLSANARTDIDIDINNVDFDPTPTGVDDHGTACAGVAAGRGNNGIGVSGAAPEAGLVGIRLISAVTTDGEEAQAMSHQINDVISSNVVHINSNSWGPSDDGSELAGPGPLTVVALANAAVNGRGGKGTIFTWAAGNGRQNLDDANCDGYANNPYVIAVGATGANGVQSSYSEEGANILVNAPSSYDNAGITTTDRTGIDGYSVTDYTSEFGGTSSACPLVAGCVALILQVNPALTARDVMHLLVDTATQNHAKDDGWQINNADLLFNRKYGFGRVNVGAAVAAAATWTNVPALEADQVASEAVTVNVPDADAGGISRMLTINGPDNLRAEHVQVTVDVSHGNRGDLEFFLTSPAGTTVKLVQTRRFDNGSGFNNWTFSSVATWGEIPNGVWKLRIADPFVADAGTLHSWSLNVRGSVGDPPSADIALSIPLEMAKYKAKSSGGSVKVSALLNYTRVVPDPKAKATAFVDFYLSSDTVLDGDDTLVDHKVVKKLKTVKAKMGKVKFIVPDDAKGKYVIAVLHSLQDKNPANNIATHLIPLDAF